MCNSSAYLRRCRWVTNGMSSSRCLALKAIDLFICLGTPTTEKIIIKRGRNSKQLLTSVNEDDKESATLL